MSSGESTTRTRILDAARTLLERAPGMVVSMGEIAKGAGVSRQALYLHFPDRTALLVEVSRMSDTAARTPQRQQRVDEAPDSRTALREAIALQATLKPELHAIATAIDVLRRTDPAAEAAWREREDARLRRCEDIVTRIHQTGELATDWDPVTASRLLWVITSQRVWDDLVIDEEWSADEYRERITTLLESALLSPTPRPRRGRSAAADPTDGTARGHDRKQ